MGQNIPQVNEVQGILNYVLRTSPLVTQNATPLTAKLSILFVR
jgi:hypothetical protein